MGSIFWFVISEANQIIILVVGVVLEEDFFVEMFEKDKILRISPFTIISRMEKQKMSWE